MSGEGGPGQVRDQLEGDLRRYQVREGQVRSGTSWKGACQGRDQEGGGHVEHMRSMGGHAFF